MATVENVRIVRQGTQVEDIMREIVASERAEDAFLVLDMDELVYKYGEWKANLPKIRPFYAVKCNDSIAVIKVLASLGCGFDCASKEEIHKVLSQNVSPKNIIYANPAKAPSYLQYAQKVGISLMTYDNAIELEKIKKYFPDARVVLRIRVDALDSIGVLGKKFGCKPELVADLIRKTAEIGLNLVGFSFHVGTGCKEMTAYPRAIKTALSFLPVAASFGYRITLLDIGGGFPGDAGADFYQVCRLINRVLEEEKESINGLTLIAEPGRYFVNTAYKLATRVVKVKQTVGLSRTIYTVDESIFGLFNCVFTEKLFKIPLQLNKYRQGLLQLSAIWGNTQSVHDRLVDDCLLPELHEGDWIILDNMGAYSLCLYTKFQSHSLPNVYYIVSDKSWRLISKEWREN